MKAITAGGAVCLMLAAGPAFATGAVPVPEPTTLSIMASAVAGLVVAYRLRRRK